MKKRLSRLYTSDIIYTIIVILVALLALAICYINIRDGFAEQAAGYYANRDKDFASAAGKIMIIVCTLIMFRAYFKNDKNAMQGMMGGLFTVVIIQQIPSFINCIFNLPLSYTTLYNIIALIVFLVMFVNHMIINYFSISKPFNMFINQLLAVGLTVYFLVVFFKCITGGDASLSTLAAPTLYIGVINAIVCMESNIDLLRYYIEGTADIQSRESSGYDND